MAIKDGVPRATLRAVLEDRPTDLDVELADVYRFVEALIAVRDADDAREAIRARYRRDGNAVLAELALAVSATRAIPLTKRALGYATSCQKITLE